MKKKVLFELSIGKGEDEIDLIQRQNIPFDKKSRIVMKDGLVYIANGNSNKIMEFSSYGDILALYYNPQDNPPPALLTDVTAGGVESNRNAYPFPFLSVGEIAVTSDNELLVEDLVPGNRVEYDTDYSVVLNRIVLRFDKSGNFQNFIGQEGIGGTPFPYIERLDITGNDEIVITARTMKTWNIYWFTPEGILLYKIVIPLDDLPAPGDGDYIISLQTIVPSFDEAALFLKTDYYDRESVNLNYTMSYIWKYDISSENYSGSFRIPEAVDSPVEDIVNFLGINRAGYFYFLEYEKANDFQLSVIDGTGSVITRTGLVMQDDEISYRDMYLDSSGLLTALLGMYDKAEIIWWRSDLLPGVQDEISKP